MKKKPNAMKQQSKFIPKNTCTMNICCLAKKESSATPNGKQLIGLSLIALGKKRVNFQKKIDIIIFFKKLWKTFPEVKKAASAGSSCKELLNISIGKGGYSI